MPESYQAWARQRPGSPNPSWAAMPAECWGRLPPARQAESRPCSVTALLDESHKRSSLSLAWQPAAGGPLSLQHGFATSATSLSRGWGLGAQRAQPG